MNRVFKNYLDKFVIVFIDDILVYSKSKEKHKKAIENSIASIEGTQLYAKFKKYESWLDKIAFWDMFLSKAF